MSSLLTSGKTEKIFFIEMYYLFNDGYGKPAFQKSWQNSSSLSYRLAFQSSVGESGQGAHILQAVPFV